MLQLLEFLQMLLYIPLLALVGQGVLYVLAGAKRETNFFYTTLRLISRPFTFVVRKITPAQVADEHVPVVTFFLVVIAYAVVTFELISLCVEMGMEHCRR